MTERIRVRPAVAADAQRLLSLVDALADYERLERPSAEARERLVRDGFGGAPRFQAYLAEREGRVVAYAITFETYSSFLALPTLYLEDIFVLPAERRAGVGEQIFRYLAGEALRRGCGRMEWVVLDWNKPAIEFYEKIGGERLGEWMTYRLTADKLGAIAGSITAGDRALLAGE
jgi:GNAT superfamily N-acetyltransferase